MTTKKCTRCRKEKPLDDFPMDLNRRDSRKYYCRPCWSDRMREHRLKACYGLTVEEYDAMLDAQGGVCAICGNPENALDNLGRSNKRLAVDHNDETGKVRRLLCSTCNTGIGLLRHSPDLLRAAAEYLESHAENNLERILL